MKQVLPILILLVCGFSALVIYFSAKEYDPVYEPVVEDDMFAVHTLEHLSFTYKSSPDGYRLVFDDVRSPEGAVARTALFHKSSYAEVLLRDVPSEYPPSITFSVFDNPEGLSVQQWAEANTPISNFNSEPMIIAPMPSALGGASGIFYSGDGLYRFDNYVLTYAEQIYVISGSYYSVGDAYYVHLQEVLETVSFN